MTDTTTKTGGQAFPQNDWKYGKGMTLRDYFAGQAMIAVIQNSNGTWEDDAISAYRAADAMIAEREK